MSYCTYTNVRNLSGLTASDISDSDITTLISFATTQLNADINIEIVRERVLWIDKTRENKIDSSNTTYYVKNWKMYYIGDRNNSGSVTIADIKVILVNNDDEESEATVSSITHDEGKFVLSTAPTSSTANEMYVTYVISPVDESTPHSLITQACSFLTAAYAFTRIDAKKIAQFSIGKVRVTRQSQAFDIYYKEYQKVLNRIRRYPLRISKGESIVED